MLRTRRTARCCSTATFQGSRSTTSGRGSLLGQQRWKQQRAGAKILLVTSATLSPTRSKGCFTIDQAQQSDPDADASLVRLREFIGWLSADIPELHNVEVPRLAESLERFLLASPALSRPRAGEGWQAIEQ